MVESPSPEPVLLDGRTLTLAEFEDVARHGRQVVLAPEANAAVRAARGVVERAIGEHRVVYGVNTGFGDFADVVVPDERLLELQANLVRSHSVGVGEPLGVAETRGLVVLRANVLAHLALALIGEGTRLGPQGPRPTRGALRDAGLPPVVLTTKEGLALINGTQLVTSAATAEGDRTSRHAR